MRRLFALLLLSMFVLPVSAHSGRTDAQGGHYDRSTGEYHFHHGFPAHQHTNGVCPYNFVDRTGERSGTSGSSVSNPADSRPGASAFTEEEDKQGSSFLIWVPLLLLTAVSAVCIRKRRLKLERKRAERRRQMEEELRAAHEEKMRLEREEQERRAAQRRLETRQKYLALYAGRTWNDLAHECGMPDDTEIRSDGYPHSKGSTCPEEDDYLVFCSRTGKKYHKTAACNQAARQIAHLTNIPHLSPCAKCNPRALKLTWYAEFKRLKGELEQYGICLPLEAEAFTQALPAPNRSIGAPDEMQVGTTEQTVQERRRSR